MYLVRRSLLFLFLWLPGIAGASDDNILISNLYNDQADEEQSYWNVASSTDRQSLFYALTLELGAAIGRHSLAPGETLGIYGFEMGLDTSLVTLNPGPLCPTDGRELECQQELDWQDPWRVMDADHRLTFGHALLLPTLRLRKGLPFSTEAGMDITYFTFSHQAAVSTYGRVSLHEGMWDHTWRIIPDVSLALGTTRFVGNEELNLWSVDWGLTVGWTFPVAGVRDSYVGTFSPYLSAGKVAITAVPKDPLPDKLKSLEGLTAMRSREQLDETQGRIVRYDASFSPVRLTVGYRVASGRFRMVNAFDLALNSQTGAVVAPTFTLGFGFLY